jgi:hypothetical protein
MVRVPVRAVLDGFAATVKFTGPSPDPLLPMVIVTNGVPAALAVQVQPPGATTVAVPVPPADGNASLACVRAKVHAAPDSVTVKVACEFPEEKVMVPTRETLEAALLATE